MRSIGGWVRRVLSRVGRDRRWISDASERVRHDAIVRERLDVPIRQAMSVVQAADRLGVTVQTIRRRVKRGDLDAECDARGRIARVYLDNKEAPSDRQASRPGRGAQSVNARTGDR